MPYPWMSCCRTVFYMCVEYCIYVNIYHVSVQGIDEHMINVHYYYYNVMLPVQSKVCASVTWWSVAASGMPCAPSLPAPPSQSPSSPPQTASVLAGCTSPWLGHATATTWRCSMPSSCGRKPGRKRGAGRLQGLQRFLGCVAHRSAGEFVGGWPGVW